MPLWMIISSPVNKTCFKRRVIINYANKISAYPESGFVRDLCSRFVSVYVYFEF